MIILPVLLTIP